jgi:hypothetical protein
MFLSVQRHRTQEIEARGKRGLQSATPCQHYGPMDTP